MNQIAKDLERNNRAAMISHTASKEKEQEQIPVGRQRDLLLLL